MCEHTSVDLHLRPGQGVPNWAAPYGTFCRRNRYKEVGCPGKPLRAGQGPPQWRAVAPREGGHESGTAARAGAPRPRPRPRRFWVLRERRELGAVTSRPPSKSASVGPRRRPAQPPP